MNPLTASRMSGAACYLVAVAGAASLAGLIVWLGLGLPPPGPALAEPWLIDGAGLLLFGVQHSLMAREGFRVRLLRFVPSHLERSVYAALSGVALLALTLTWQSIDGPEWWRLPTGVVVVPLAAGLALAAVNLRFDHVGLFGLRQAWRPGREEPERLVVAGPYRWVRHPLMSCLLAFLWLHPVMTPTLALLAGGLSLYIILGTRLEERDLLVRFGPAYAAYRRRVPAFLPWRRPAPPEP